MIRQFAEVAQYFLDIVNLGHLLILNYYPMIHLTQANDSSKTKPVVYAIGVLTRLYVVTP